MNRINSFSDGKDETLINLVSQHAILYDFSEKGYKYGPKKDIVWNELEKIINKSGKKGKIKLNCF